MDTVELFGFTWNNENLPPKFININVLTNDHIGKVVFTMNCLQTLKIDNIWEEEDYYKILSLIHEKTIYGKPYFIFKEGDQKILEEIGKEIYKYTPVERDNVLHDFPGNIIEIQRRSLLMLYIQYPKYGEEIKAYPPYGFFSNDETDLQFILEAMQRKSWLDIKIQRYGDGGFTLARPYLIAEEGWFEIERDLEMNFAKQVFVAMCFDEKMDKAAKKIGEAVEACGLKAMIINRKEHNNDITGEILSEIKNSRLIIADVTGQRNGVYFEAGFAFGHQKSVIWTCQKDDFENVHFDTSHYNHIIWDNEDDLYRKLKDRIIATLAVENK
jgi:nucleoside 2-deoxyribosyltransferase